MLMIPRGPCWVVTLIYPPGTIGPYEVLIDGERALATRRIFRTVEEACRYRDGIAKCYQAKYHKVQGVMVFSEEA